VRLTNTTIAALRTIDKHAVETALAATMGVDAANAFFLYEPDCTYGETTAEAESTTLSAQLEGASGRRLDGSDSGDPDLTAALVEAFTYGNNKPCCNNGQTQPILLDLFGDGNDGRMTTFEGCKQACQNKEECSFFEISTATTIVATAEDWCMGYPSCEDKCSANWGRGHSIFHLQGASLPEAACSVVIMVTVESTQIQDAVRTEQIMSLETPPFIQTLAAAVPNAFATTLAYTSDDVGFSYRVHIDMPDVASVIKIATEMHVRTEMRVGGPITQKKGLAATLAKVSIVVYRPIYI
jgi:hypothetical protein